MDGKPETRSLKQALREVVNFIYDHKCVSRTELMIGGVSKDGFVIDDQIVITYMVPALLYDLIDEVREMNQRDCFPYITVSVGKGGIVVD